MHGEKLFVHGPIRDTAPELYSVPAAPLVDLEGQGHMVRVTYLELCILDEQTLAQASCAVQILLLFFGFLIRPVLLKVSSLC